MRRSLFTLIQFIPARFIYCALFCLVLFSCASQKEQHLPDLYPQQVGDIPFNADIDDKAFTVCHEENILQYYNFGKGLQYKGEKIKIDEHFRGFVNSKPETRDTGFITIRFIVNCKGETGRYRIQQMNNDYNETEFTEELTEQLLAKTKELNGWIIGQADGNTFDYYQHLIFKIENGNLIEVLP